jgi:VanZ family protein
MAGKNQPAIAPERLHKLENSSRSHGFKFWLSAWFPVVVCIGVIVMESTMSFGADHTSKPLRWLYEALFGHVSNVRWEAIHHLIRKCGHFFGYGLIGLAWLHAWWMTLSRSSFIEDAFFALLATSLVACADELHQSYLLNRSGSSWDVLLDCAGAVTMLLVTYIYLNLTRSRHLARAE